MKIDYWFIRKAKVNMKDVKTFFLLQKKLLSIMSHKQICKAIGVLAVILIAAAFETLGVSAMLPFIQALTEPENMMDKKYVSLILNIFHCTSEKQVIIIITIGVMLIYIIKNLVILMTSYIQTDFVTRFSKDLSVMIMNSYLHRPYSFFTNHNSSEIIRGVSSDVANVNLILIYILHFISELCVVALISIFLIFTDPLMALGIICVAGFIGLLIVCVLKKKLAELGEKNREADGNLSKITIQIAYGIKDILVMQKREKFLDEFAECKEIQRKTGKSYTFFGLIPERIIETFCVCGILLVVIVRYMMGVEINTFISTLAVFAMAAFRILPSVSRISGYLGSIIYYRPSLESAYDNIVNAQKYSAEICSKLVENDEKQILDFKNNIVFNGINWKYSEEQESILQNLSLCIKKGEAIGIIGESGSGKSTLSDILLGLYVPQSGTVEMDGISIFSIPKSWSKLVGYVPQSVYLLDDTIRANIAFGENIIDDKRIRDALEKASLLEYVLQAPQGLDTMVGEKGIKLSGGQRQRIAIARALYRNPQILILDEATSALDNETESAVMEAIDRLQGTITMIIIAHRLTTIKKCDYIYEIKNGNAIEKSKEEIFNKSINVKEEFRNE